METIGNYTTFEGYTDEYMICRMRKPNPAKQELLIEAGYTFVEITRWRLEEAKAYNFLDYKVTYNKDWLEKGKDHKEVIGEKVTRLMPVDDSYYEVNLYTIDDLRELQSLFEGCSIVISNGNWISIQKV